MESNSFSPDDFLSILKALNESGRPYALIGGQAVNLWAIKYLGQNEKLNEFQPFTSKDLDVFTSDSQTPTDVSRLLGVSAIKNQKGAADPIFAAFTTDSLYSDKKQLTQFLHNIYGVKNAHVTETIQKLHWDAQDIDIQVLHPLYALASKLACLRGLSQQDRQDAKHARMAVCFSACYLNDVIAANEIRIALGFFEFIFQLALSPDGLHAWKNYQIQAENAIPYELIENTSEEKLLSFRDLQLPRLQAKLAAARA